MAIDPEGLPVGPDGLPEGTPPWDDPEGALMTTWQPPRPRRRRSKWGMPGYPRRWVTGAIGICLAVPTVGFGLWIAGLHLFGGRS